MQQIFQCYCMIGQDKNIRRILYISIACLCAAFGAPKAAHAATMTISSAQEVVYQGDTVRVDWFLNTEGESINVVDATIVYDPHTLGVQHLETGTSSATVWAENPTVQKDGVIHFAAGFPAGIQGNRIPIFTTTFTAKKVGNSFFGIVDTLSHTYLSDGAGTQKEIRMAPVSFAIVSAANKLHRISSGTHPKQDIWYKDHDVQIHFDTKKGEEYSYSFSTAPDMIPGSETKQTDGTVSYKNVPDGVYYFKLAIRTGTTGWQEGGVYRVQIDSTAPNINSAIISNDQSIFDGKNFVSFVAVDKTSGIAKTQVRSGYFGFYRTAENPHKISRPIVGNFVRIRARDVAGNTATYDVYTKAFTPTWLSILFVIICTAILLRYKIWHRILYVLKK